MGAQSGSSRRRWWWLWVVGATVALAVFEGWVRPALDARSLPTGDAEWIWAQVEPDAGWVGFFAVRDFQVETLPEAVALIVGADEAYVVFLNGKVVGTGSYQPGSPLDAYNVTSLLVEGKNRLVVELRSTHGIGGFLLSLDSADGPIVVSDEFWGVVNEYREDLKWPGEPTGDVLPVKVWGKPPSGRWGTPKKAVPRPRLRKQLLTQRALPAETVRVGQSDETWYPLPAKPLRDRPLGRWLTFDFGREVSGFVNLVTAKRGGARGLVWVSTDRPVDPTTAPPTGRIFVMVGQGSWTDAIARRFRYVTIVSLSEIAGARAFLLEPDLESELIQPMASPAGVLGLEPPVLRSPVENEFWSEFESLAGGGSGEDL